LKNKGLVEPTFNPPVSQKSEARQKPPGTQQYSNPKLSVNNKPDPAKDPEYQKYLIEQRNAAQRNRQQLQAQMFGPSEPLPEAKPLGEPGREQKPKGNLPTNVTINVQWRRNRLMFLDMKKKWQRLEEKITWRSRRLQKETRSNSINRWDLPHLLRLHLQVERLVTVIC
jgi:hypothetical protein